MENRSVKTIYGIKWSSESAKLSRAFDLMVAPILLLAIIGASHLNFMLLVGDWDFWKRLIPLTQVALHVVF